MTYKGKNIWIIGASSGIGAGLAGELSARGATLALSARNSDSLMTLKTELGRQHGVFPLDVGQLDTVVAAADRVRNFLSRIDHVILLSATYTPGSLAGMDIEDANRIINVNLIGTFNVLHAVLPILRVQKSGQIALCGSVAGYRGLPNAQPYAATKAAVISLAETARLEEAKNGIDVRIINPGFVRTPMTDKNSFPMPMMITAEEAAKEIADGLLSSLFEIHFPRRFTWLMKLLRFLPDKLYFMLLRQ